MSGVLCDACHALFETSKHQCGAALQEEIQQLKTVIQKGGRYLDSQLYRESCKLITTYQLEIERLRAAMKRAVKRCQNCSGDEGSPTLDMVEIGLTEALEIK